MQVLMKQLARIVVCDLRGETRFLYITADWTEKAWREYAKNYMLVPKYIVNVWEKVSA
jgi:hypothetical protein